MSNLNQVQFNTEEVANRLDWFTPKEGEEVYSLRRKHWSVLLPTFVTGVLLIAFGVFIAVQSGRIGIVPDRWIYIASVVVVSVGLFSIVAEYIQYRQVLYLFTTNRVVKYVDVFGSDSEISFWDSGKDSFKFSNYEDRDYNQSVFEKYIFKSGTLNLYTAGSGTVDTRLPSLPDVERHDDFVSLFSNTSEQTSDSEESS